MVAIFTSIKLKVVRRILILVPAANIAFYVRLPRHSEDSNDFRIEGPCGQCNVWRQVGTESDESGNTQFPAEMLQDLSNDSDL